MFWITLVTSCNSFLANNTILSTAFLSSIPFKISLLWVYSSQCLCLCVHSRREGDIENAKKIYLDYTLQICIASPLEVQLYILYTSKNRHTCWYVHLYFRMLHRFGSEVIWFLLFPWMLIWPLIFSVSKCWQALYKCQNDTLILKAWNYKRYQNWVPPLSL